MSPRKRPRREVPPSGVDLTEGPFEPDENFRDAVLYRLAEASWRRYPAQKQPEAVCAIAAYLGVSPENILLTRGASEGISLALREFADEDSGPLVPAPGYFGYEIAARAQRIPIHSYSVNIPPGMEYEPSNANSKSPLVVCSPNNPTGNVVAPEYLLKVSNERSVICDLTYDPFANDPLSSNLKSLTKAGIICVYSLSKAFSLAGARAGILIARPEIIERMSANQDRFPLDYFQLVTIETLFDPAFTATRDRGIAWVRRIRPIVKDMILRALPRARIGPCQANFIPVWTSDCPQNLIDEIVAIADCKHYKDDGLLRVTVNPSTLAALRVFLSEDVPC